MVTPVTSTSRPSRVSRGDGPKRLRSYCALYVGLPDEKAKQFRAATDKEVIEELARAFRTTVEILMRASSLHKFGIEGLYEVIPGRERRKVLPKNSHH